MENFVPDTSREEIAKIRPFKVKGLYFEYGNEKLTPSNLYFGIDTRRFKGENGVPNGRCFCHYDNALRPVYLPNGKRYIRSEWANVSCRYKDGLLYDFHRQ